MSGYDFAWSEPELFISPGDTVTWEWKLTRPQFEADIFQTPSASESSLATGGFSSERGATGTFSYTFNTIGTYYYASDIQNIIIVRGVVHVGELMSQLVAVRVLDITNGFEAEYIPDMSDQESGSGLDLTFPDSAACSYEEKLAEMLQLGYQEVSSHNLTTFMYTYSVCETPVVYSVHPNEGTLGSNFVIEGTGFSMYNDSNTVLFSESPCTVVDSNDTTLTCQFGLDSSPMPFTELSLAVHVAGRGNALIRSPESTTVSIIPVVTGISPRRGSLAGGTDIVFSGWGFPVSDYETAISIGGASCTVTNQSYSTIQCTTSPNSEGNNAVVIIFNPNDGTLKRNVGAFEVQTDCFDEEECNFEYSLEVTPMVTSISMVKLQGPGTTVLRLNGSGFSETPIENEVMVGEYSCMPTESSSSHIQCEVGPIPAGTYTLSVQVCQQATESMGSQCLGFAEINPSAKELESVANITSISPASGSVQGGTLIAINGVGFESDDSVISVTIDGNPCTVMSASYSQITCQSSAGDLGTFPVEVNSHGISFPANAKYSYSEDSTPVVTGVSPQSGQSGEIVEITGSNLDIVGTQISIGGSSCEIDNSLENNDTTIHCMVGPNLAGEYPLAVNIEGVGDADTSSVTFTYTLELTDFNPKSGSLAGRNTLTLQGLGLNPNFITITMCDQVCELTVTPPTLTTVQCEVPPATEEKDCNVTVESLGETKSFSTPYQYLESQTPIVTAINDTRGGTQGGSVLLLSGEGFTGSVTVTIAGVDCEVVRNTETDIVCVTGASGRSIRDQVFVIINEVLFARSDEIYFWYIDVWSSPFTWGGGPLPREGDFVVIPRGQTLVLDTITPVLAYLLIQGGELIFDDEQDDYMVQLHTEGALITEGGRLQIGTESEPFLHKTMVVLYGHVLSTEIPVYGAKTLALRKGEIDMHGKPLDVTWTRLAQTANPGDTTILLQDAVDWEVGGKIVIASTSYSQRENEEVEITNIDQFRTTLTVTPALTYEHISVQQLIEGRYIDTSAEVGYLTRNIVVRGNLNEEWVEDVEGCDEEFRPGQFEIQTCFLGRFGDETLNDQFGSQIMIHAAEQNQGDVIGRFEYVEVTHAGQAFRLGRYPIHFHLNGDVSTSYVRGCAIHHTFNRAVTIHAVNHLLVERNVAYDILGHAYFLEDGIEEHNIIQDNLGIFVRASSSLLNVDITPATFWVVNPNNIVRRNAAAGGTHFGFWYRLPQNPTGPSATSTVCPRNLPLEEFSNNTAHSFGWYGLWVDPSYTPRAGGGCGDSTHAPAVFESFLAWRNDRGIEFTVVGSLQIKDSILLDNRLAGVEITELNSVWGEDGPLIEDTLIVGHSELSPEICTQSGIKGPKSFYLTVSRVTFVNFDRTSCAALQSCSQCKDLQGGFESRYREIRFVNSPRVVQWQWPHEHVHRFLDDSLPGSSGPISLIPTSEILPTDLCQPHDSSVGASGSVCDGSVEFVRFALYSTTPADIQTSDIHVSSPYGTTVLEYRAKRLLTGTGQMGMLERNQTYHLDWPDGRQFTNISYDQLLTGFGDDDYILFSQTFPRSLDFVTVNNQGDQQNDTIFDNPGLADTGDWYIDENHTLFYVVKGSEDPTDRTFLTFSTLTCQYEGCIAPTPPTLPPPGRPDTIVRWSNTSIWPNGELPKAGEDVYINCSFHMLVDIAIPRLGTITICGGLELEDTMNHIVEADLIFLEGGLLIAGYPDTPFTHSARFVLHGDLDSPEYYLPNEGPILGAKAIGVFGELMLHAETSDTLWTRLAVTASAGSNTVTVADDIDWMAGDEIVITSTSFEALETEMFQILEVSGRVITLNGALSFDHIVEASYPLVSAEVGLLTRSIVIENGDSVRAEDDAFGCRVLVGSYFDQIWYVGSAKISGVEFKGCGQAGFTEEFDPRFALAILSVTSRGNESYVQHSSIHNGYNTGIGVFGTSGVIIDNNVIHDTVGPSLTIKGSNHEVTNNLASMSRFPGTYRRNQPFNPDWTANYEVHNAEGLVLTGNVAAGGAKAGFHTRGVACIQDESSSEMIANNVAHSVLHGVHMGYSDGHWSGCSKFPSFTVYACYHYGIFAYSTASVMVSDALLANNVVGVFAVVIGPPALSHVLGDKTVNIESSTIVSATSQFDCEEDDNANAPVISLHENSHSGLPTPSGGHAGIIIPSFVSGSGHYPTASWFTIITYPAISGGTTITDVTFVNFNERCDNRKDRVLMTFLSSEDCYHPVFVQGISFTDSDPELKILNRDPNLSSVNPSDCVDMDCDGLKKLLIKDMDGSFTGTGSMMSLTSVGEFEWDGDVRRGIGDYRIPRTMLSYPNGSRIDADRIYPFKGIVRSTGSESTCEFVESWNMYRCSEIDHLMLVIESLDIDTEVRRLSPIGIGSTNGYIDLLNGPQDNGWCGGYTCQERISTFYALVAAGLVYTIGLTSTNPQDTALHLLHSDSSDAIVVKIIYTNPQRLDVYFDGSYVVPKNAIQKEDGNLEYMLRDASNPNAFDPLVTDPPGTNYYDRDTKQLHITIQGTPPVEIRTQPVIQVALDLAVSVADFFDPERLVQNLAFLLGIPDDRIRVVDVVRESVARKRRQDDTEEMVSVVIEVGDPPSNVTVNPGMQTNQTNDTTMPMEPETVLTFEDLNMLQPTIVQAIQTEEILDNINATIESATVQSAEPPATDPTGGVRATNETGGIQPDEVSENDTVLTFYEQQILMENAEENDTEPIFISIPSYLGILQQPSTVVREGVVFSRPPALAMYDERDDIVESLGVGDPWVLTATIKSGPDGAYLMNEDIRMIGGQASFDNLTVSHPGTYVLEFNVTYPTSADSNFYAVVDEFSAVERSVSIIISTPPRNGNTTFPLYPYPEVHVIDPEDNSVIVDHGWRNRTWYVTATAQDDGKNTGYEWTVQLTEGRALFTDIVIPEKGDYQLVFTVTTEPQTQLEIVGEPSSFTSEEFDIVELPSTRIIVVYDDNCTDVLTAGEEDFIEAFTDNVMNKYDGIEVYNVMIECGSITVSFFATAASPRTLQQFVDTITLSTDVTLTFVYNSQVLQPSSVIQDPNYPVEFPPSDEDDLVLILATTIPSVTIFLAALLLIFAVCMYQRHRNRNRVFKIHVKPVAVNPDSEGRYIEHRAKHFPDSKSVESFYLMSDRNTKALEAVQLIDEHEMSELPSSSDKEASELEIVVSTEVKVPAVSSSDSGTGGEVFVNPSASAGSLELGLQDSLEEIFSRSIATNDNDVSINGSNNNNNNNNEGEVL